MNGRELRGILDIHQVMGRVYADPRFPPPSMYGGSRAFVLHSLWVIGIEKVPEDGWFPRMCELMPHGSNGFWEAVKEDAPRYEPPEKWRWEGPCQAPMVRQGRCEKRGKRSVRIVDPQDGTWHLEWYCSKHYDVADAVIARQSALCAAGVPEPLPNVGGVMPSYLRWDWPEQYLRARPGWKAPTVGIYAEDWPVMTKVAEKEPFKLSVHIGEGERCDDAAPTLRIIKGGLHP